MKKLIQSVKGTRDFYPEEMAARSWLYETIRRVSERFGYQEYEGPFLETIELYAAKSGEELVNQQSFVFPDRGGNTITLRPELTPTLARMVAQRQGQLVYPLRWWSFGPFWRYERPQKGRGREFFQWNIDLIGPDTPEADAELIAIAASFFKETGLAPEQVSILVNDRRLMNRQFEQLGIPEGRRGEVLRWIDRRDKMSLEEWEAYGREAGLSKTQLGEMKARLENHDLWKESTELGRVFSAVEAMGVGEYVRFAPHIIRGLLYYTGTVFEAWDMAGEFRALFGGGRYDNLVSDVGGDPLPATGFALGDMVITLILKKFGCLREGLGGSPAPVLVTVFDEGSFTASFALASKLRSAGINAACYPEAVKLAKQIKYADRMGFRVAAILGPEERARGEVNLKDLRSGSQRSVPESGAAAAVLEMLASPHGM
jgi:histidyl-tRNA synthetase